MLKDEVTNLAKKSSVYMVGQFLSRAVGFLMIPVYTAFISPTNYGVMELIEITTAALGMIAACGVSEGLSRFYYGEKDPSKRNRIVSTALIGIGGCGFVIVSAIALGASSFSNFLFESDAYTRMFQIAIVTVWFGLLCDICFTYLRMMYMAKFFVITTLIQLMIALSLNIWFVVFMRLDILGIFYSTIITQALVATALGTYILKRVGTEVSRQTLKDMISYGAPLVPARMGLMLGFMSNRYFLRYLSTGDPATALAQVGLLSLGHKFAVIINRFVTVPFNSFWGPRRHELLLGRQPHADATVARVCTYSTILTVYLALFISAGIESLIEVMAAASYSGAHVVVPFIALSYVALSIETHFNAGLLYKKKTIYATYASLAALTVVILWNWLLIPEWGLYAAATSNLAGFSVRLVAIYLFSQKCHRIPFELGRLTVLMCIGIGLFFASQTIHFESPYYTFVVRELTVATFPLILFVVGFLRQGERETLIKMVGKGCRRFLPVNN